MSLVVSQFYYLFVQPRMREQKIYIDFVAVVLALILVVSLGYAPISLAQDETPSEIEIGRQVNQGRIALEAGKVDEALTLYQEILRHNPNHVEAHFRLGSIYWRQKNLQLALQHFQKSVELDPDKVSLRLSLGGFYEQVRQLDAALNEYQIIIEKSPDSNEARIAKKRMTLVTAKNFAAKGQLDKAIEMLESLLKEYPEDPRVLQHLGFAYMLANRLEDAAVIYNGVLKKEPKNDLAHMNLAAVYEKMADFPKALHHLQRVEKLTRDELRLKEAQVRIGLLHSEQAKQEGDTQGALNELIRVLEINPNHPVVNDKVAEIYYGLGRLVDAEEAMRNVLRVVPKNLDVRLRLANLYLQRKNAIDATWELLLIVNKAEGTPQAERAKELLQKLEQSAGDKFPSLLDLAKKKNELKQSVIKAPDDVEASFNLGVIYLQQKQLKKAKESFENVRRIDPTIARAYLNLGQIYGRLNQFSEAMEAYGKYISLETDFEKVAGVELPYSSMIAQYLYTQKQYEAALFQFYRVREGVPDDVLSIYYSALILALTGEVDEAIADYKIVLEKVPGHFGARTNLALLYQQLGREEEALTEFKRVAIGAPEGIMKQTAEKSVIQLKRVLNGLSTSAGYTMTYDSNNNNSKKNQKEEYYSSLTATFAYRYKYKDKTRMLLSYSPTYSTYHKGQFDFLNQSVNSSVTYDMKKYSHTLRYNYLKVSGVLNQRTVNKSNTLSFEGSRQVWRRRTLQYSLLYRKFDSASSDFFNASTLIGRTAYSRRLGRGLSDNLSYSFAWNDNDNKDNKSAAYRSHSFNYKITKWISPSQSLGLSGALNFTNYIHEDEIAKLIGQNKRREIIGFGLTLSYNYRINDKIRFFTNYVFQGNDSNLPIFVFDESLVVDGDPSTGIRPIKGEDLVGVPLQSASLGTFSKNLITLGLSVAF